MWYIGALIVSVVSGAELSFTYSCVVDRFIELWSKDW